MRFRALESLFDQHCVFDLKLLILLKNTSKWWSSPFNPLVSIVTRLHWNWQRYQHFLFMSAKCISERKNHFLTNNVFLTLHCWFCSKLLPNGRVWPFNPLVSLVTRLTGNWQRYQHFLFLCLQNAFQSARITFQPTMCFSSYIVDFAQNYFQIVKYGPITLWWA